MRVRRLYPALIVAAAAICLVASVVLIWAPWVPLNPRARCGWTCYIPDGPGPDPTVLDFGSRNGFAVAPVGAALLVVSSLLTLTFAIWRARVPRLAPGVPLLLGLVGTVASVVGVIRVWTADAMFIAPSPNATVKIGEPGLSVGGAVAVAVGIVVCGASIALFRAGDRPPI